MARTNKFKKKPKPTATATGKPKSFPVPSKKHGIKHKTKKSSTSSLFGPLSAQQPRGLKWNLTASMGGASAGSKKSSTKKSNKKKLNTSTRHIKSGERQDQTQKVKSWTLNMPVVSQSDQVVPWLVSRRKRAPSSPSDQSHSNRIRKIHTGLSLPVASLANLNAELQSFSEYVKLNEAEISSRLSVVELIQSQCRHLFGVCPEACKVFGSFACLPVCNFISDVDMAIHDVVQAPPNSTENTTATTVIEIHDTESDDEDNHATPKRNTKRIKTETQSPHPNLKRQGRVLAWKKALEAAEEEKKQHLASRNMNSAKAKSEQMSAIAGAETMQQISSDSTSQTPLSRKYAPLRVELAESKPLPPTAVPNDEGLPLFVIDREGCPDVNEKIQSPITPQDTDIPTVTDVSKESSIPSDEEEKKDEDEDVAHSRPVSDAKHLEDSDDDEEVTQQHDDDSDADTADVLAVLNQRKIHDSLGATTVVPQSVRAALTKDIDEESNNNDDNDDESEQEEELHVTKTRPRSRSLISLCSATTCSDTEEKDWDDSGMEVSFVSNASSTRTLPAGPTLDDDTRGKVIRALNSLSRRLRGNSLTSNIHVRKKAKVPIINMETRFGYECDIAIGGHNGTDTSSFASSQCNKFQSFATVVLLLKILLNQHGLDKPFTGGIGSFKLYVLVASHIEKHLELGGEDDAAEILITFLFRYGSIPDTSRSGLDNKLRSPLKEDTIVTTQGKGPEKGFAEMGSVFQIDNCIRVFQACYFILRRKLQKPSTDPSHSILGYIIDAQWLREERKDCQRLIPASTSHADRRVISTASPNFPPGLPFNWRENACARSVQSAHQKNGMKKQRHGTNETAEKQLANGGKRNTGRVNDRLKSHGTEILIDTDDEAEQLKVGYGMSTPSGISYPSKTTPKNSKRAREKNKKTPKANKGGKRFSI